MSVPYQSNVYQPQPKVRFEWINESWQLFTANAGTWIGAILIYGVIVLAVIFGLDRVLGVQAAAQRFIAEGTSPFFAEYRVPAHLLVQIATLLVQTFFLVGLMQMANAQVRRQPINIGMLFGGGKYWLPMLGFHILLSIASAIGLVLIVFPVFLVLAAMTPAMPLIADGVPVVEAINRSWSAIKPDLFMAAFFTFVMFLIVVFSFAACLLGEFATYPMAFIILALVYRDMIGMPLGNAAPVDANIYGAAQPGVWPPAPGSQLPYDAPSQNPYAPQPSAPPQSAMPPFYQTPLAGAPESRNPDEPEIGGESAPGTLPPAPPSTPSA